MKKTACIVLICLLLALIPSLAEEEVSGNWYLVYMTAEGTNVTPADGFTAALELRWTGDLRLKINGETGMGTWSRAEDGTLLLSIDGDESGAVLQDGVLRVRMRDYDLFFDREQRENPPVSALPGIVPAENEEAFHGLWKSAFFAPDGKEELVPSGTNQTYQISPGRIIRSVIVWDGQKPQVTEMTAEFENGRLVYRPALGQNWPDSYLYLTDAGYLVQISVRGRSVSYSYYTLADGGGS